MHQLRRALQLAAEPSAYLHTWPGMPGTQAWHAAAPDSLRLVVGLWLPAQQMTPASSDALHPVRSCLMFLAAMLPVQIPKELPSKLHPSCLPYISARTCSLAASRKCYSHLQRF